MADNEADFIVVGAGIAGASAACFLAEKGRVLVLERETQPGYHTTGRSAALYSQTYGNAAIRAITVASEAFFRRPPPGFAEHTLLSPRGALLVGRADQTARMDQAHGEFRALVGSVRRLDKAETLALHPALRPDYVAGAVFEPEADDMDVAAIHGGFLRALRAQGGSVRTRAEVVAMERSGGKWRVRLADGSVCMAPVVVNAAGAWCDAIGALAGAAPIGLVPKRRTAFTFDPPRDLDTAKLPIAVDIAETFYFKPEAGRFLGSPADETPSEPCDAQPEELDIAVAVERIEEASTLRVGRIASKWAGLRSFVKDKSLVIGHDASAHGFFWLAGQGGYGIQTSPAAGRIAAALATGAGLPADVAALGVTEAELSPARLR